MIASLFKRAALAAFLVSSIAGLRLAGAQELSWINGADYGVDKVVSSSATRRFVTLDHFTASLKRWNYDSGDVLGTTQPDFAVKDFDVSPRGDLFVAAGRLGAQTKLAFYSM